MKTKRNRCVEINLGGYVKYLYGCSQLLLADGCAALGRPRKGSREVLPMLRNLARMRAGDKFIHHTERSRIYYELDAFSKL